VFVVVEGPNGVGKTTVARHLVARLLELGRQVRLTAEPSDMPLGRLVRASESRLRGRSLALAIAADRYAHLDEEIIPALRIGDAVADRYVQSSLVLQRIDGLELDEIWRYNEHVLVPTLSFYLEDDASVIADRLASRRLLSRLERAGSPGRELRLYAEAREFLNGHGWRQERVDCRGCGPQAIVSRILHHLDA
jgi:dTMP kinase